jgi:hypothetical protein
MGVELCNGLASLTVIINTWHGVAYEVLCLGLQ